MGRRHSIGYIYIGLNCTFVSAVFNFSLPDIVTLTSAHLYRLYITHLYQKFFNITIRYYTMTKWFSYSKITPIFTYVISFLEIEMHLFKKMLKVLVFIKLLTFNSFITFVHLPI